MRESQGFTIIELVAIMVLLGILSVYAIPKINNTSDFDRLAARNQILAAAHLAQQHALYDSNVDLTTVDRCYRVQIRNRQLFFLSPAGVAIGPSNDWRQGIFLEPMDDDYSISLAFDNLGNIKSSCNTSLADTDAEVEIDLGGDVKACFSKVGYIRACKVF